MMMRFSDLNSAANRPIKFKPSVKEVHVTSQVHANFEPSTRSRQWSYSEQEQLSGLFVLPQNQGEVLITFFCNQTKILA